jgi:hypothetical protein
MINTYNIYTTLVAATCRSRSTSTIIHVKDQARGRSIHVLLPPFRALKAVSGGRKHGTVAEC